MESVGATVDGFDQKLIKVDRQVRMLMVDLV